MNRHRLASARPRFRAALIAAIGAFSAIWGYNWVVTKNVPRHAGPFDFAASRTFCGALRLFAVAALLRRPLRGCEEIVASSPER